MKDYYVYILRCSDDSYYTGVTNDYCRRMHEHQEGINPSCYTFKRRPVELVYVVHFENIFEAIAWEKQLKKWNRKKKEAVMRGEWEKLPGLSQNKYMKRITKIRIMVRQAHHDIFYLSS